MFHGVIACKDGTFYISEIPHEKATDALLQAESLLLPAKDLGVLGVINITTLHAEHPCPDFRIGGKFFHEDAPF